MRNDRNAGRDEDAVQIDVSSASMPRAPSEHDLEAGPRVDSRAGRFGSAFRIPRRDGPGWATISDILRHPFKAGTNTAAPIDLVMLRSSSCWMFRASFESYRAISEKLFFSRQCDSTGTRMAPRSGCWSEQEAGMAQLDDDVGLVMKKVKDMGVDDNTIVVFTTDSRHVCGSVI
jgi:hypothetical protein